MSSFFLLLTDFQLQYPSSPFTFALSLLLYVIFTSLDLLTEAERSITKEVDVM